MSGDLEKTLELLREAHRAPIGEAHYAAVRARVLSRLGAERRTWWQMWAYGLAVVAVAALLVGRIPRSARVTVEQPLALPLPTHAGTDKPAGASGADHAVNPGVSPAAGRRKRPPHHAPELPAAYNVVGPPAPQPLVVKLVTNDPNVVIYWISGE